MKLLNIFAGYAWGIEVFFFALFLIFFVQAVFQSKSGTEEGGSSDNPTIVSSKENMKLTQMANFKRAMAVVVFYLIVLAVRIFVEG